MRSIGNILRAVGLKLRILLGYLRYYLTSQGKEQIESPFVARFYREAIVGDTPSPSRQAIEELRGRYAQDQTRVAFPELGAGSPSNAEGTRSVSEMVRSSAKPRKYSELLFRICDHLRPQVGIELGTCLGISTAYLASSGIPKLYSLEGCEGFCRIAEQGVRSLGYEQVEFILGNFDDTLPVLLQRLEKVDFAFVDGNHRYDPTMAYFYALLEKSTDRTCLVFDDIRWSQGMLRAWSEICAHPRVSVSIDLHFVGIVFLDPHHAKQHFVLRY